jgi:hypothetical protein
MLFEGVVTMDAPGGAKVGGGGTVGQMKEKKLGLWLSLLSQQPRSPDLRCC